MVSFSQPTKSESDRRTRSVPTTGDVSAPARTRTREPTLGAATAVDWPESCTENVREMINAPGKPARRY